MRQNDRRTLSRILLAIILLASGPAALAQMQMPGVGAITVPVILNPCPGGRCVGVRQSAPRTSAPRMRGRIVVSSLFAGTYNATPALRQEAVRTFVARARRNTPRYADEIARELSRNDYAAEYAKIVRDDGFRTDNLSDSMAAYALVGWIIVNDHRQTTRAQAAGLRRQFATRVAADPQLLTQRAQLGEELKILTYIVASGMLQADKAGTKAQYARGIEAMMQQKFGLNLRALKLTDVGFVDR